MSCQGTDLGFQSLERDTVVTLGRVGGRHGGRDQPQVPVTARWCRGWQGVTFRLWVGTSSVRHPFEPALRTARLVIPTHRCALPHQRQLVHRSTSCLPFCVPSNLSSRLEQGYDSPPFSAPLSLSTEMSHENCTVCPVCRYRGNTRGLVFLSPGLSPPRRPQGRAEVRRRRQGTGLRRSGLRRSGLRRSAPPHAVRATATPPAGRDRRLLPYR